MAFDREHLEISWIFRVANTEEVAVTGLSTTTAAFDSVAALGAAEAGGWASDLYDTMGVLLVTAGLHWAVYSSLTDVKIAAIDTAGHYLADPVIFSSVAPDVGDDVAVLPQSTVVGSLRTDTTLGAANYGRMYLPHTKLELATGQASANTTVTGLVSIAFGGFIAAVNAITNVGPEPSVVSIMSALGAGTAKPVTRVAIGSVTDTQRRRRNRIPEVYSFTDL